MTDAELIARLERLERDNRRLKRSGLATFVIAVALYGIYAVRPVPQIIKAHEFELVDGSGKVGVKIHNDCVFGSNCEPEISLFDTKGRERERLQVFGGLPSIWLLDPKGNMDVSIRGGPMFQASPLAWGTKSLESEIDMYGGGGAYTLNSISLGVSTSGAPNITLDGGSVQSPSRLRKNGLY